MEKSVKFLASGKASESVFQKVYRICHLFLFEGGEIREVPGKWKSFRKCVSEGISYTRYGTKRPGYR